MKIKTKKEMNLPQLIEWGWKNIEKIEGKEFKSNSSDIFGNHSIVQFSVDGYGVKTEGVSYKDTFTVEIEEEITEDTKLDTLIEVYTEGSETIVHDIGRNIMNDFDRETPEVAINDVCSSDTLELHTLIGGKLVKIWSKEKGLVE